MGKDGLTNLNAAQLLLADFSNYITGIDFYPVYEFHRIITAVNTLNNKVIPIFLHLTGVRIKIISLIHRFGYFTDAGCTFYIKLDGCCRCRF